MAEFLHATFIVLLIPGLVIAGCIGFAYFANNPNTPLVFRASRLKANTSPFPTREEFVKRTAVAYREACRNARRPAHENVITEIERLAGALYDSEGLGDGIPESPSLIFPGGNSASNAEQFEKGLDLYEERTKDPVLTMEKAADAFANAMCELLDRVPVGTSPFQVPLSNLVDAPAALSRFSSYFERNRPVFSQTTRSIIANSRKWDTVKDADPVERSVALFEDTPLHRIAQNFAYSTAPLAIPDSLRFRHQFVVGPTGSGKTTFLSAQINADLDRVARGEASVFVMDSQNELVPNIARLARFAPGGDLAGKLIYLEPDPDFPLALNIFDFDRTRYAQLTGKERVTLMRGAEEMIGFFIQSLVRADTTGFMDSIIKPVLRATMLVPDATVFTFRDFLQKGGFAKHEPHLAALSDNDRRFLTVDMFDTGYTMSLAAMRTRMAAFTSDELFTSMFSHPRNRLDLFSALQEPRVILVNTMGGMLKGATEPFGRFFIAKLLQATEERMFLAKENRLPVYAYIDEAQDYIQHDDNIPELIQKARKQNVGFTIATHSPEDFDPPIRGALEKAGIQARGQTAPHWRLSLSGAEPVVLNVDPVDFGEMRHMSDRHFDMVQTVMRKHFSTKAPETPRLVVVTKPSPPEDMDTGAKPWP